MKKKAIHARIAALTAALLLMTLLGGCGRKNKTAETAAPAPTAAPVGTTAPVTAAAPVESPEAELKTGSHAESGLAGTWQTASIGFAADGTMAPEYYVQFTDAEIVYGHMRDGAFVSDRADRIVSLTETAAGGFRVQAESANGLRYTYQTCESDENTLEYYETWDEQDFPEMYRGGASLSRSF